MSKAREARNRRWSTLVWGSIPVVLLAGALTADHIPGTDIRLTVPYAAEGPGPTFDTLGEVGGEAIRPRAGGGAEDRVPGERGGDGRADAPRRAGDEDVHGAS